MQQPGILFVCEFITGGGLCGAALPQSLLAEGLLMRDALLKDLSATSYRLLTTHDVRVLPSAYAYESLIVLQEANIWALWQACIRQADMVWLVAPETDGTLYRLTEMAEQAGKTVIGASSSAVYLTASKWQTYLHCRANGIATIPTWQYADWLAYAEKPSATTWLAKPDDGAGCNETYVFASGKALSLRFENQPDLQHTHVIQPYLAGVAASISIVSNGQQAYGLSYNLQMLHLQGEQLVYAGGVVNGALEYQPVLKRWINEVQASLPALRGYYGVDILISPQNGKQALVTLIEINPRLTTSYAMLAQTMQCNPAHVILNTMLQPNLPLPLIQYYRVAFEVAHAS